MNICLSPCFLFLPKYHLHIHNFIYGFFVNSCILLQLSRVVLPSFFLNLIFVAPHCDPRILLNCIELIPIQNLTHNYSNN